ncbi:hypothetical protein WJX73_002377 [Symbiochloris irregularis]|uniref:Uncharacterized protein n=1 Tax=Symbiochloris irregularis TaxID=706552 RepID=A0AAW1P006_9CHLO
MAAVLISPAKCTAALHGTPALRRAVIASLGDRPYSATAIGLAAIPTLSTVNSRWLAPGRLHQSRLRPWWLQRMNHHPYYYGGDALSYAYATQTHNALRGVYQWAEVVADGFADEFLPPQHTYGTWAELDAKPAPYTLQPRCKPCGRTKGRHPHRLTGHFAEPAAPSSGPAVQGASRSTSLTPPPPSCSAQPPPPGCTPPAIALTPTIRAPHTYHGTPFHAPEPPSPPRPPPSATHSWSGSTPASQAGRIAAYIPAGITPAARSGVALHQHEVAPGVLVDEFASGAMGMVLRHFDDDASSEEEEGEIGRAPPLATPHPSQPPSLLDLLHEMRSETAGLRQAVDRTLTAFDKVIQHMSEAGPRNEA